MIHIVFQQADVAVLEKSFHLDESLRGQIAEIKDDYAVGPLKDIYSANGIETRKQWWKSVLASGDNSGYVDTNEVDDNKVLTEVRNGLTNNPEETLWIWFAPNKHDVSGYYWLISQLKGFLKRVFVLHLHNLPFIHEKGHLFYPNNIFDIPPREFLKAKKLAKMVTSDELEADGEEWAKIIAADKGVRILEGEKKLVQYDYDYYDCELISYITADWQRVNRLFHSLFSKSKNTTGDAFLFWRLKLLIADGKLDGQGKTQSMKELEVKLKGVVQN